MKNKTNIIIYIFAGLILLNLVYLWGKNQFSEPVPPGKKAPLFSLPVANGKSGETISLAGLKGNVVVLDFWSTSCPPCIRGMSILKRLHVKYNQKGVKIIGVNVEGAYSERIREFAHSLDIPFPLLMDRSLKVAEKYGISALPTTFIIDRNGVIRYTHQGLRSYDVYEQEIEELLNEK